MKLTLPTLAPRNPFARAASRRAAGIHRPSKAAPRRAARRAVQRELDAMTHPSP